MKKIKNLFILIVILCAGWVAYSQDQDKDLSFVKDAASGGLFEVQIGKLVASKAKNGEVKAFAQKMVADHSKANEELKKLAATKKIALPEFIDVTKKEIYDSIALKTGEDFEREYIKQMVKAHDEDVNKFEAASKYLADADLRAWAVKTLPTLKMHQKHVHNIASKDSMKKKGKDDHKGHAK